MYNLNLGAGYSPDFGSFTNNFSEPDLGNGYLTDNFDFTTALEAEAAAILGPNLEAGDLPDSFDFTTTLEPEKRSDIYPIKTTPFSIAAFGLQATYNSSQTTVSNSSKVHSQNSAAYNQEIMMEDEDNQIEEFFNSDLDETSEKSTIVWTKEEDLKLIELVNKIGMQWQKIAKKFQNKTSDQVKHHYQDLHKTSLQGIKKLGRWSKSENKQLISLISELGGDPKTYTPDDWRKIATKMESRSLEQIKLRWQRYANSAPKASTFTLKEDQIIIQKVKTIGKQWSLIAESLPGRTGKQIKQHYDNSLDDRVRKSKWTEQEEQLLKDGFTHFGNKWAMIAEFINDSMKLDTIRTGKQCSNHWTTLCKRSDS